ncbi:MAG: hypothetical protein RSC38_03380, partial [Oscillospiraceae bacterium]
NSQREASSSSTAIWQTTIAVSRFSKVSAGFPLRILTSSIKITSAANISRHPFASSIAVTLAAQSRPFLFKK